jgi:hypothetical protein
LTILDRLGPSSEIDTIGLKTATLSVKVPEGDGQSARLSIRDLDAPAVGTLVGGCYELLSIAGVGPTGPVYAAEDRSFERFNPFLAFERLPRATVSSESA